MKALLGFPLSILATLLVGCTFYKDVDPHLSGWRAPSLSAPDHYGREVNIKKATSGPWAVVFFYPKADTPG
jgi:hypothetical protein